ncbi:MAG: UDP-glucose 4-epimerase GalE [Peptostreptococcaceae bacterium]|nr:UDP-glucose 4-epimerase GalE [Peptostreptococcaceae bacterium]
MAVLVTGGAGYIGSHTVKALLEKGEEVLVADNLQTGHKEAVWGGKFYEGDLRDKSFLRKLFSENSIEAVIHFAANSLVGESMTRPYEYYENNVYGTLCLLQAMQEHGTDRIVFSSTAATYGEPERVPIEEGDANCPTNTYGETKLAMEKMMHWFDQAHGIRHIALRYFNAAGADESGKIGEDHKVETHLIPIVLSIALGKRESISIFGDDYDTKDGSCIRDYIHVSDLAQAHLCALEALRKGSGSRIYNLGSERGYSVKEIIETAREVTGHRIPAVVHGRRAGDPAVLIASAKKIREELGWICRHSDIKNIIESAWKFHQAHPQGYGE